LPLNVVFITKIRRHENAHEEILELIRWRGHLLDAECVEGVRDGSPETARYSPEFKAEALRLIAETDEPIKTIARDLGVSSKTLHEWKSAARPEPREPFTEDERGELQRLRREIIKVRMERDILKKATAFFAKQSE
jgi:transposase